MAITAFCRTLRSRWQALSGQLWPCSAEQQTEAELVRLKGELARRYRRLLQRRGRIEQIHARLAEQEKQIDEMSRQALDATGEQAGELASSLERHQRAARRNRERLREHEQAYGLQLQTLERKKHLRLALLRGEMVVAAEGDGA